MNVWEAHAASRLIDGPVDPLPAPDRFEWTQRPGIGPGAEILGKDLNGPLIMELGCGAGHNTAHLAAAGARAIGVDRSSGQVLRAIRHYQHTGAVFVHGSALTYLTRTTGGLDAIVSVFGVIGMVGLPGAGGPFPGACGRP
jgi:SAM-dependent methyltransferase